MPHWVFPPLNPLNNHPNPLSRNGRQCLPYSAYSLALCARYKTNAHISVCAANRRYTWSERVGRATSARRTALQSPRLFRLYIKHASTTMHKILLYKNPHISTHHKKSSIEKCLTFLLPALYFNTVIWDSLSAVFHEFLSRPTRRYR